jgi:hypothetical protein
VLRTVGLALLAGASAACPIHIEVGIEACLEVDATCAVYEQPSGCPLPSPAAGGAHVLPAVRRGLRWHGVRCAVSSLASLDLRSATCLLAAQQAALVARGWSLSVTSRDE